MPTLLSLRFFLSTVALAAVLGGTCQAVTVPFRTNFTLDTVGLPPNVGGPSQPTSLSTPEGSSITVVDALLGLDSQPVEIFTPVGAATWLTWNLAPAVADLGVDIRFSVSFQSAYSGTFFELTGPGGAKVRLNVTVPGELRVSSICAFAVLGTYSAGTPVPVVVRFSPPASFWVIADGENNGFEDNTPAEGDTCQPGNLTQLNAYAWRSSGTDPVTVAFDDLVVTWLPIFVDGFETADTGQWSAAVP